jgi:hypothetical protein
MPISNCAAGAEQFESSPRCPCGVRESQVIVLSEDISSAVVDSLYLLSHTCLSLVFQVPSLPGRIPKHRGVSGCIEASVLPRTCGHSAVSLYTLVPRLSWQMSCIDVKENGGGQTAFPHRPELRRARGDRRSVNAAPRCPRSARVVMPDAAHPLHNTPAVSTFPVLTPSMSWQNDRFDI